MHRLNYEDPHGYWWVMELPDNVAGNTPEEVARGIVVGPPDLMDLDLPLEVEHRLNIALYSRGLITKEDMQARPNEILAALQSALQVDAARVMQCYYGGTSATEGSDNG